MKSVAQKKKPRIVVPVPVKKRKSGRGLLWLVYGTLIGSAVTFALAPDRDETPRQRTHWETRELYASPPTSDADRQAMENLIDESIAKAEAHKVPRNAVAMLQLYGSPTEQKWADTIVNERNKP